MPDAGATVEQLVVDLGGSLESSVLSSMTDPVVGWVASFLGLGGDATSADAEALATISATLTGMQKTLNGIIQDINGMGSALENYISATSFAQTVAEAITDVDTFRKTMTGSSPTLPAFATTMSRVTTVANGLVGNDSGLSGTGYLSTFLSKTNLPYYADGSPLWLTLAPFIVYYKKVQAVLAQMAIEAAHTGQLGTPPQTTLSYPGALSSLGYPPPNYDGAQQAYTQYTENVSQQATFEPFPTTGVPGTVTAKQGYGANEIVFDRTNGWGWGFRNAAYSASYSGNVPGTSLGAFQVSGAQTITSSPGLWMLRLPSLAELTALYASLKDPAGNPVTSTTVVAAMQHLGFDVLLLPLSSGGYPFLTSDVLDVANWSYINYHTYTVRGREYDYCTADGYQCSSFFDLLNGVPVTVQLPCTTSPVELNSETPTSALFSAIGAAAQANWGSGSGPVENGYCDIFWIYQLANAHPPDNILTDPPVEEPSSIQIDPPATNPQGEMQFTASAVFQRFDHDANAYKPVTLNIPQVAWTLDDLDAPAQLTQSGLMVWTRPGSVTVRAIRGPLSATMPMSTPPGFAPDPLVPVSVNVFPRQLTYANSASSISPPMNCQILWSDGRTSLYGDGGTDKLFAVGGDIVPPYTCVFAEANGLLTVDPGRLSTFTIPPGSNSTENFHINVTVTAPVNDGLSPRTDQATIAIT